MTVVVCHKQRRFQVCMVENQMTCKEKFCIQQVCNFRFMAVE